MTDGGQLELPGIDLSDRDNDTPMVRAVRATVAQLREEGKLARADAAMVQLALSLAAAIDGGARSGRASAVAMAAQQLRDTLLVLDPPPEEGTASEAAKAQLNVFMRQLEYAANHGGQLPATGWEPGD